MKYTSNMGMNLPDDNDYFSIDHANQNTQALDIVGKPDEYKNTKTYAVGDLCIYDNVLYKCITAVETAESFDVSKWEPTNVLSEIAEQNKNFGGLTSSGSINVTSKCPDYKKMKASDFLLDYQSMAVRLWDGNIGGSTIKVSKSYNSSTGVLTLSNLSASASTSYVKCTVGVYAKVN